MEAEGRYRRTQGCEPKLTWPRRAIWQKGQCFLSPSNTDCLPRISQVGKQLPPAASLQSVNPAGRFQSTKQCLFDGVLGKPPSQITKMRSLYLDSVLQAFIIGLKLSGLFLFLFNWCSWHITLCEFKGYSMLIWYTYILQYDYHSSVNKYLYHIT